MGHKGEIHVFLNRCRGKEGEACLFDRIDIRMVSENRQRMAGNGSSRDMKDGRHDLARYLVHVGDHKEQALGCRKCCGQGARGKRPMNRTRRASFRLHFHHSPTLAEDILASMGCPLIAVLPHTA